MLAITLRVQKILLSFESDNIFGTPRIWLMSDFIETFDRTTKGYKDLRTYKELLVEGGGRFSSL